jgi:hypothetical protein
VAGIVGVNRGRDEGCVEIQCEYRFWGLKSERSVYKGSLG